MGMTERKPPGMSFESWVDRQIRQAKERGEFDDLPGAGRPLPGAGTVDDENWWLRGYLERQGATDALVPPAIRLRKELDELPDTVRRLRSEQQVRSLVDAINERVEEVWRGPASGPPVRLGKVDPDAMVALWRAAAATLPAPGSDDAERSPRRWWGRINDGWAARRRGGL
jgi:hypothetical protein